LAALRSAVHAILSRRRRAGDRKDRSRMVDPIKRTANRRGLPHSSAALPARLRYSPLLDLPRQPNHPERPAELPPHHAARGHRRNRLVLEQHRVRHPRALAAADGAPHPPRAGRPA